MKIRISEQRLANIIRESILSEETATKDIIWIAYGENKYDAKRFTPLHGQPKTDDEKEIFKHWEIATNKPLGGLWACPLNDYNVYDWLDFQTENEYDLDYEGEIKRPENPKFFLFRLKPSAKILTIGSLDDLRQASTKMNPLGGSRRVMDFDAMVNNGYDGLFVRYIDRNCYVGHESTSSYDVPSICVWNKEVIVPIGEDEKMQLYRQYKG